MFLALTNMGGFSDPDPMALLRSVLFFTTYFESVTLMITAMTPDPHYRPRSLTS